jgi:hypothetical protein
MHELLVNLHMHTRYSDGTGDHADIAAAAIRAGLDAVIVTDHNVLVRGAEGYVGDGDDRVLMLIGEEVHDQRRDPQKNHLLVFGADQELATLADDPTVLLRAARDAGALSFIAHPTDPAAPVFGEHDISWVDWSVSNFTGIELWNGLSELKTLLSTRLQGAFYAFFPALVAHSPISATIRKWDELLENGRVVAIGGSDAHALHQHLGPLKRTIYPYQLHFSAINTHVLVRDAPTGDPASDRDLIYEALASGHCFVGCDLPVSTRGFRFTGHGDEATVVMGDEISAHGGVTLEAHLPTFAEIRLLRNGQLVWHLRRAQALTYLALEPGVYRVEVYRTFLGARRGWIFSNPIYVR